MGVEAPDQSERSLKRRRTAMLLMLAFIYSLNYLDRQIVIILQEPIKADFGLADWELGLLTGGAFGLFYTAMGIPIAHVIDRGVNRVRLIAAFTATWSAMTALCGLTRSFAQFFGARMGVGLAEAGFAPAAHSLISDLYPPRERPAAAGLFAIGVPVGIMAGLSIGGIVAQATDWRTALLVAGLPGIIIAIIFPLVAHEPVRGGTEDDQLPPGDPHPRAEARLCSGGRRQRRYRLCAIRYRIMDAILPDPQPRHEPGTGGYQPGPAYGGLRSDRDMGGRLAGNPP
jgi:MFS family permease